MSPHPLVRDRRARTYPPGRDKGAWLAVLEQGAHLLQTSRPMGGFDVYVVGFHCARHDPHMQMEAHHFCRVVNDDFLQCVLFDGNTKDANLIGVEYIVSEELFATLPEDERALWHPHNYEVLSGELVAPGLPEPVERTFLARLLNSYGKTWHTWHTADAPGHPAQDLPLGEPRLMWSFNRDGERHPALGVDRDAAMDVDTAARRRARQSLVAEARPQHGVDAMRADYPDAFPHAVPIPGVVDAAAPPPG